MADLSPAVLAKLAALRANKATPAQAPEPMPAPVPAPIQEVISLPKSIVTVPEKALVSLSTTNTSDINHLEFLSKMNELQEAIHAQHPQMPTLLRQIHRQLMNDPELTTLLNEEAIGVIVKGLEVVTKTELISVVLKESKTKAKKIPLDTDMF